MAERSKGSQLPGTYAVQAALATIALGTADEVAVWKNDTGATVKITAAGYLPDTAVTGNTTNNFTLQMKSKTAAGAAAHNITAVKTYGTGVNMTQWVKDALTLSTTAADLLVDNGETVTLDKAETGSGLALPAGLAVLNYQFV